MTFNTKRYEYRVYDGATYITTWSSEVLSEPHFRMVINGGPGEMVIRLARKFDNFGENRFFYHNLISLISLLPSWYI